MNKQDEKNEKKGPAATPRVTCPNCGHADHPDNMISFMPDGEYCPRCGKPIAPSRPFSGDDIEDIVVLVVAGGKHYPIVPRHGMSPADARDIRLSAFKICISDFHAIVEQPFEDMILER